MITARGLRRVSDRCLSTRRMQCLIEPAGRRTGMVRAAAVAQAVAARPRGLLISAHPVGVNDVAAHEHWDGVLVHITRPRCADWLIGERKLGRAATAGRASPAHTSELIGPTVYRYLTHGGAQLTLREVRDRQFPCTAPTLRRLWESTHQCDVGALHPLVELCSAGVPGDHPIPNNPESAATDNVATTTKNVIVVQLPVTPPSSRQLDTLRRI
jgi:hypothetical protein